MNPFKKLFSYFETYHGNGRPMLKYTGAFIATTYVFFYLIRFTKPNPNPFDDLWMRLIVVMLFIGMAVKDRWPEHLKKYYLLYSYLALIYCLPFFNVLVSLQRGGGVPAISNCFIALAFLVMVADWRNTIAMLFIGISLAAVVHFGTTPGASWPTSLLLQIPAYLVVLIGGGLFKLSEKQIEAEKAKVARNLAYSIAHETRNPLGQVSMGLKLAEQELPVLSTLGEARTIDGPRLSELYRLLARCQTATHRGIHVIQMTLDQVGDKPIDTSTFKYLSAAAAVNTALKEFGFDNPAHRQRVSVYLNKDFRFLGDETGFVYVMFNLLKNAIYYFDQKPSATLSIVVEMPVIRVRDTGPGIPKSVQAKLFGAFQTAGKAGGTGLGLSYTRRLMHAFGGDIKCESVEGEFTEFTLTFPRTSAADQIAHEHAIVLGAKPVLAGKRVLVVDDEQLIRGATQARLKALGCVTAQAENGRQALEELAKVEYDAVIMDLRMPVMDGFAAMEKIRAGEAVRNKAVPIVVLSSESADDVSVAVRRAGANDCLTKPVDSVALAASLRKLMELRSARGTISPEVVLRNRTILVADDSDINRRFCALLLRKAGVNVLEVTDGQAVLDQLESGAHVDAILMDMQMPGVGGVAAAQAIRSGTTEYSDVIMIGLSADTSEEKSRAALAAGMNDYMFKPLDVEAMLAKLASLISARVHEAGASQ